MIKGILIGIVISAVVLTIYFMGISYVAEVKIQESQYTFLNKSTKKIAICNDDWINYLIDENNQTHYLEEGIYKCGEDTYEACDSVNGNQCNVSKEYRVAIVKGGSSSPTENLGISGSISTVNKKDKWYGIIQNDGNVFDLYLFNKVKIPLEVYGNSFRGYHLGMIIAIVFFFLIIIYVDVIKKINKKENQMDERGYEDHGGMGYNY